MGLGFFMSIIVGGLAGWIGSKLMNADTGILLNVLLGIIGAALANFILSALGIYAESSFLPQLIVGTIGAMALIALGRAFR